MSNYAAAQQTIGVKPSHHPTLSKSITTGKFQFTYYVEFDPSQGKVVKVLSIETLYDGTTTHCEPNQAMAEAIKKMNWKELYEEYQEQLMFESMLPELGYSIDYLQNAFTAA